MWLKLTSDGANPASPANVSKCMAVALLGVVDCDLGEVLERTCRTTHLTLNSQTHRWYNTPLKGKCQCIRIGLGAGMVYISPLIYGHIPFLPNLR